MRRSAVSMLAALALSAPAVAAAQAVYAAPHLTQGTGPVSATLDGRVYVNRGLVGAGRVAAAERDFEGETLGSFSGLALDRSQWRRAADGSYTGRLLTLPDRGPNNIGDVPGTSNYRPRVHAFALALRPDGALALDKAGGTILTDGTGSPFTGKDPGEGVTVRDGQTLPLAPTGRISLDPEGIARLADGSFYVSDEYAAGLYYFSAAGRLLGVIPAVPALAPMAAGKIDFGAETPPQTGRRNNQGLEGVSVTPDGRTLVAVLQSAPMQDNGKGAEGRFNTRILVYDLSGGPTPQKPAGHYVLQLPVVSKDGTGGAPDATAAVSELLALDASHFLVLARDSLGRGGGPNAANSPVFKSVLVVSTQGATNLAGSRFETTPAPAAPGGVLDPAITPAHQAELVNLLAPDQLARFGLNLKTAPSDAASLSEKWEGMTLAPALDPKAPDDVLLLVGNDNDFVTAKGRVDGQDFDAALKGAGGTGDSDSRVLVYRLTLPRP